MKTEPKAFASLSSGLLARKGAARPAMRPQGFGQSGAGLEDLGWNDMGIEPSPGADHDASGDAIAELPSRSPLAGLTPVESPVHGQQAEIAGRLSAYVPDDAGEEEDSDDTGGLYQVEPDEAAVYEAPAEVTAFEPEPETEPEPEPAPVAWVTPVAKVARRSPKARSAAGSGAKAAFTLRLNPERHLKLRLACAVSGQSAQMLVTQAVDGLLAAMPELDAMALKAKPKR